MSFKALLNVFSLNSTAFLFRSLVSSYPTKKHLFRFFEKVSLRKKHKEVQTRALHLKVQATSKQRYGIGEYEVVAFETCTSKGVVIMPLISFPCSNLFSVP